MCNAFNTAKDASKIQLEDASVWFLCFHTMNGVEVRGINGRFVFGVRMISFRSVRFLKDHLDDRSRERLTTP